MWYILKFIIIWQGKSERSDWFFLGRDFAIRTVSVETVLSCVFFCFRKPANSKQVWCGCHIINYLLTKLARAVLGNIGPRSFLYGPRCARSVLPQPRANIPQCGPRARFVRGNYFYYYSVKRRFNAIDELKIRFKESSSRVWSQETKLKSAIVSFATIKSLAF